MNHRLFAMAKKIQYVDVRGMLGELTKVGVQGLGHRQVKSILHHSGC
jgi:hypothetical protein